MGRGVVDGHVENTLESFLAAVDAGADWVEGRTDRGVRKFRASSRRQS